VFKNFHTRHFGGSFVPEIKAGLMKKILLGYIVIPLAIKAYMLLGIVLFRIMQVKESIMQLRVQGSKPVLKHSTGH
jgi:hypothetical protein